MGVFSTNLLEIVDSALIKDTHVSDLYNVLTGVTTETINLSGMLQLTGSANLHTASIDILTTDTASINNATISQIVNTVSIESASISHNTQDLTINGTASVNYLNINGATITDSVITILSGSYQHISSSYVIVSTASIELIDTNVIIESASISHIGTDLTVNGIITSTFNGDITGSVLGNVTGTHNGPVSATTVIATGNVTLTGLPTTDPNVSGRLWRSGSFLMIS